MFIPRRNTSPKMKPLSKFSSSQNALLKDTGLAALDDVTLYGNNMDLDEQRVNIAVDRSSRIIGDTRLGYRHESIFLCLLVDGP